MEDHNEREVCQPGHSAGDARRVCEDCGRADRPDVRARESGVVRCDVCHVAALAHGHGHVDHGAVPDCPKCFAAIMRAIIAELFNVGVQATFEYPGYLDCRAPRAGIYQQAVAGTANLLFGVAFYCGAYRGQEPDRADEPIPDTHRQSAEGIARWIAGTMYGDYSLRAYGSKAEQITADRAESRARGQR